MKKYLVMALAGILAVGLVACGKSSNGDTVATLPLEEEEVATEEPVNEENTEEPADGEEGEALAILENVWATYSEEEKFPSTGGDISEELTEGPGKVDISDAEKLDALLGFPSDKVEMIDECASLTHMMNLNTFTSACYHVSDNSGPGLAENVRLLADDIKVNILGRQWICGFPDVLVIYSIDTDFVVTAFGKTDIIDTFCSHLTEAYPDATLISRENLE